MTIKFIMGVMFVAATLIACTMALAEADSGNVQMGCVRYAILIICEFISIGLIVRQG